MKLWNIRMKLLMKLMSILLFVQGLPLVWLLLVQLLLVFVLRVL